MASCESRDFATALKQSTPAEELEPTPSNGLIILFGGALLETGLTLEGGLTATGLPTGTVPTGAVTLEAEFVPVIGGAT